MTPSIPSVLMTPPSLDDLDRLDGGIPDPEGYDALDNREDYNDYDDYSYDTDFDYGFNN